MKPQQFAALTAAALASLVLAIAAYTAAAPWKAAVSQGKLFPGLASRATNVSKISVTQGPSSINLERKGDVWTLKDRDSYPADSEKVRALLSALITADLVEPKTRKVEHYTKLEVEDPAGNTANSNLLKLMDDAGQVVAELIVGKKSADAFGASRAGTFVRKPGEELSWLINAPVEARSGIEHWVKPRVFESKSDKIRKIKLEVAGEAPLDIAWEAASKRPRLVEVPKGKRVKYANSIDEIGEALSEFDLEDVRKATSAPAGEAPVSIATVEIDGGLKVVFKVRREKDGDWLSLEATGEGEPKKFADDLTAAVKDWQFKLKRGKADEIFKTRAELLQDDTDDTVRPGMQPPVPDDKKPGNEK